MKRFYLILAVLGAILPYIFFGQYFLTSGLNLPGVITSLFVNPLVTGFTVDLVFTSFVFWIMMFHERIQGNGPNPLIFIMLNLLIGLSCAFPAYLYARSSE
jgi:hypothetical protein